jgi:hypothetical protein
MVCAGADSLWGCASLPSHAPALTQGRHFLT